MKIRTANQSDISTLYYLINKKADFDKSLGDFNDIISTSKEKIKNTMFNHQPFAWAFLAVTEKELPVGMALYHIRYSSFKGLPYIWLDDLFILDEYRRFGLGKKLFNELEYFSNSIQATHIGWVASDFNINGKMFYSKLGSKIIKSDGSTLFYEYNLQNNK